MCFLLDESCALQNVCLKKMSRSFLHCVFLPLKKWAPVPNFWFWEAQVCCLCLRCCLCLWRGVMDFQLPVCWNHDKSNPIPIRNQRNCQTRFAHGRTWYLCSSGTVVSFTKSGGEKQWTASVICETYQTNWQTESHHMNEDLELHLMVQWHLFGALIFFISPTSGKDRSRLHQFGTKMLPGIFIGYALNSGGG